MSGRAGFIAMLAAILAAITAAYALSGDSQSAVLWIDSDGGTCVRQSIPQEYDSATACGTFNAAYIAAQPGDRVLVKEKSGGYAVETIANDSSKTSNDDVLFEAALDENPAINGDSNINGDHITFKNLSIEEWDVEASATDITFDNVDSNTFDIFGTNVSINGGDFGPVVDDYAFIGSASAPDIDPAEISITGAYFHDSSRSPGSHIECLHVASVVGFTLRNSKFEDCAVFDVFFTLNKNGVYPQDITVENNWFAPSIDGGVQSVTFDGDCIPTSTDTACGVFPGPTLYANYSNVIVRNNSFGQEMSVDNEGNTLTNFLVQGNLGDTAGCNSQANYQQNLWIGTTCGASDVNITAEGFVDKAGFDYHLAATSSAVDRMTSGCPPPSVDIDGETRPQNGECDAGADESPYNTGGGGGTPTPTPTPTPSGSTAHLWVDTSGGACTRNSSPATWSDANACSSFQNAYNAANCGDNIKVKNGTYNGQILNYNATKGNTCSGNPVVIEAETIGSVNILDNVDTPAKTIMFGIGRSTGGTLGARDITIRGMNLADEVYFYPGVRRVIMEDMTMKKFYIRCANDITIRRSTITKPQDTGVPTIGAPNVNIVSGAEDICPASTTGPSGIVLEDNYFFRIWRSDPADHLECLHVLATQGLIIRRNRFHECLIYAISFNELGSTDMSGILVENNSFWKTYGEGTYPQPTNPGRTSINLGQGGETIEATIRFNTFEDSGGLEADATPVGSGINIHSNIFENAPSCLLQSALYDWRYNVAENGIWQSGCDDAGSTVGAVSYVDRSNGDLHLNSGAFALGKGNPTSPPTYDYDNESRPQPGGSNPDAGMDERG
jgi:hypothetical protein